MSRRIDEQSNRAARAYAALSASYGVRKRSAPETQATRDISLGANKKTKPKEATGTR